MSSAEPDVVETQADDVPAEAVARERPRWRQVAFVALAVPYTLFHLWIAYKGWPAPFQRRALHIGGGFALLFLWFPIAVDGRRRALRTALDVLDVCIAVFAVAQAVHLFQSASRLLTKTGLVDRTDAILGVVTVLIVLEGTRRVLGWGLTILGGLALAYIFLGHYLPGAVGHGGYSLNRAVSTMYLGTDGIFGTPTGASVDYVFIFLFFAVVLERAGASAALSSFATAAFGRFRGGPAKVAVVGSSLYGTISGSSVANAASIGPFSIPMMIRSGIRPRVAASIESVASVGGQFVPPVMGATAFIIAELLAKPYGEIIAAAAIPAAIYYVATFLYVHSYARAQGIPPIGADEIRTARHTLAQNWFRVTPLLVLILLVAVLKLPAGLSALYAAGLTIVLALTLPEVRRHVLRFGLAVCRATSLLTLPVVAAVATAGIVVGALSLTGIGDRLASLLVAVSGGNLLVLLIITMVAALILGAGLPTVPTYIMLVVLLAPALIELGVPPLAAHFFIFYYGVLADLTPPTAVTVVVSAGIAGENPWKTMLTATRVGMFAYIVPLLFALYPTLVLQGPFSLAETGLTVLSTVVGVVATVAATQGWLLGRLPTWARVTMIAPVVLVLLRSVILSAVAGVIVVAVVLLSRRRRPVDVHAATVER
ncbi:TRAP transporter permease [Pseudonocardia dioxanivorans]|uniref:TRAP transporter permease n=1 Tax=Pseudonocardia dioxanivorans TaxID=240495 RepID=UPI000CD1F354|nr:TRAP transporter fused permease subunit [Pseudonocardia dioxanivorans]